MYIYIYIHVYIYIDYVACQLSRVFSKICAKKYFVYFSIETYFLLLFYTHLSKIMY